MQVILSSGAGRKQTPDGGESSWIRGIRMVNSIIVCQMHMHDLHDLLMERGSRICGSASLRMLVSQRRRGGRRRDRPWGKKQDDSSLGDGRWCKQTGASKSRITVDRRRSGGGPVPVSGAGLSSSRLVLPISECHRCTFDFVVRQTVCISSGFVQPK